MIVYRLLLMGFVFLSVQSVTGRQAAHLGFCPCAWDVLSGLGFSDSGPELLACSAYYRSVPVRPVDAVGLFPSAAVRPGLSVPPTAGSASRSMPPQHRYILMSRYALAEALVPFGAIHTSIASHKPN